MGDFSGSLASEAKRIRRHVHSNISLTCRSKYLTCNEMCKLVALNCLTISTFWKRKSNLPASIVCTCTLIFSLHLWGFDFNLQTFRRKWVAEETFHTTRQRIEWLHIPKTGTSFGNMILHWACPDLPEETSISEKGISPEKIPAHCLARFRSNPHARKEWLIGDHFSLTNRTTEELKNVFTMIRSPSTRILSGYHWYHQQKHLNASENEICSFAQKSDMAHVALGAQTRLILGYETDKTGYHFKGPFIRITDAAMKEACSRLRLFAFVGITDFHETSNCIFRIKYGNNQREQKFPRLRRGPNRTLKSVDCGDRADETLFNCALEIFLKEIKTSCMHIFLQEMITRDL